MSSISGYFQFNSWSQISEKHAAQPTTNNNVQSSIYDVIRFLQKEIQADYYFVSRQSTLSNSRQLWLHTDSIKTDLSVWVRVLLCLWHFIVETFTFHIFYLWTFLPTQTLHTFKIVFKNRKKFLFNHVPTMWRYWNLFIMIPHSRNDTGNLFE